MSAHADGATSASTPSDAAQAPQLAPRELIVPATADRDLRGLRLGAAGVCLVAAVLASWVVGSWWLTAFCLLGMVPFLKLARAPRRQPPGSTLRLDAAGMTLHVYKQDPATYIPWEACEAVVPDDEAMVLRVVTRDGTELTVEGGYDGLGRDALGALISQYHGYARAASAR